MASREQDYLRLSAKSIRDRIIPALLWASVAWSCVGLANFAEYFLLLRGKSLLDRGTLASSDRHSFLARSGRRRSQHSFEQMLPEQKRQFPPVALGWRWVMEHRGDIPDTSRVFLSSNADLLYYYATSLWYPVRVEVTWQRKAINDQSALRLAAERIEEAEIGNLSDRGYTHAVVVEPEIRIVELGNPGRRRERDGDR